MLNNCYHVFMFFASSFSQYKCSVKLVVGHEFVTAIALSKLDKVVQEQLG